MKDEKELSLQEVPEHSVETERSSECSFCSLLCRTSQGRDAPDTPSLHFMTEREIRILDAMRRLKEEASSVRKRLRQVDAQGMPEERSALSKRLDELRTRWKEMDRERMDAAEERMRLLGHVQ